MNKFYYDEEGFAHMELTNEQKSFLDIYEPKDDMFTSREEIEVIAKNLALGDYNDTEMLRGIRNEVVEHYDALTDKMRADNDKNWWNKWNAMQSVTAVIDSFMYKINKMAV